MNVLSFDYTDNLSPMHLLQDARIAEVEGDQWTEAYYGYTYDLATIQNLPEARPRRRAQVVNGVKTTYVERHGR